VEAIGISKFRATCLAVLEDVRTAGEPVARIEPPAAPKESGRRLGTMAGSIKILGDIVGPTTAP
jgi:hypothetical protein